MRQFQWMWLAGLTAIMTAAPAVAQGQKAPIANAGTLTCLVAPEDAASKQQNLSCTLERNVGPPAQFSGTVKTFGTAAPKDGKIVLIWSVLAPKSDIEVADLSGRYVGAVEGGAQSRDRTQPKSGGLVGGANGAIRLVPLKAGPSDATNIAGSILDLELSTMKA
jgi:hypothetical protein